MRFLLVVALTLLAGCAANSAFSGYCTVYELPGGIGEPWGLVLLPPPLEAELRSQLPAVERSKYVCWYATGDRLIAGGRRDLALSNLGYVFIKRGDSWVLSDSPPIILSLPRAIQ
jgi:hypothetical protein